MIKKILDIRFDQQFIKPYIQRIKQDMGSWRNETATKQYQKLCKDYNMLDSIRFAWLGESGYKQRTSGINTFWTKLFSLKTATPQARRNLLTYTEEFDNAVWANFGGGTVTANQTTSPIGTLTADKFVSTVVSQRVVQQTTVTGAQTFSVWLKAESNTSLGIQTQPAAGNDLITPVNVTTEWQRFQIPFTVTNVGGTVGIRNIYGNSFTVYIWGAQLEVGSSASAYQRVIDANSWDGVVIDATQTTSTNQPYLAGNIAPNEKWCLKNPNGGDEYMTHPTISFAANEAWTVSTVVGWNGVNGTSASNLCASTIGAIRLAGGGNNLFRFVNSVGGGTGVFSTKTTNVLIGKSAVVSFVAKGDGVLLIYINGVYYDSITNPTALNISNIFNSIDALQGSIHAHIIRAQALTPTQVAAEANFLRSLYPEIPSVTIGSQVWATSNCEAVCTPMGNLITNVTENANVEKITNAADREFSSDTGFWTKIGITTIGSGVCNIKTTDGTSSGISRLNILTAGKYYKLTYSITRYSSGIVSLSVNNGALELADLQTSIGTYNIYFTSSYTDLFIKRKIGQTSVDIDIDNVSIQEIGWSGSTDLYNAIYAQTAGTDEQKTYAAVKAAAMWSYYNNDPALGAVYGKLYNWYAVKLLQMDIDYYNAANPSTPWGWRVPTDTDFNDLSDVLGGTSVAGGKMKVSGTTYWNSPNTGADNSSGFSFLPVGIRNGTTGDFSALNSQGYISTLTKYFAGVVDSSAGVFSALIQESTGMALRLIKS